MPAAAETSIPRALKQRVKWWMLCYAIGVVLLFVGLIAGRLWSTTWPIVIGGFGGVALWFSSLLVLVLFRLRDIRWVRSLGGRACTECMYDLTALPASGNCPECGTYYTKAELIRQWRNADRSYQAKNLYTLNEEESGE